MALTGQLKRIVPDGKEAAFDPDRTLALRNTPRLSAIYNSMPRICTLQDKINGIDFD